MANREVSPRKALLWAIGYCAIPIVAILFPWQQVFGEQGVCGSKACRLIVGNSILGLTMGYVLARGRKPPDKT